MSFKKNKNINQNQGRIRVLPCILLYLYPVVVFCDIITTYISTPDLTYEGNPFILSLSLGWVCIILISILFVAAVIGGVKRTSDILSHAYIQKIKLEKKRIAYLGILFHFLFIFHFLFSIFAVFNNILSYFYLNGSTISWVRSLTKALPALHKMMLSPQYFFFVFAFAMLTLSLFYIRIMYLRRRVLNNK